MGNKNIFKINIFFIQIKKRYTNFARSVRNSMHITKSRRYERLLFFLYKLIFGLPPKPAKRPTLDPTSRRTFYSQVLPFGFQNLTHFTHLPVAFRSILVRYVRFFDFADGRTCYKSKSKITHFFYV